MTTQDGITRIEELARMGMFEAAESACRELLAAAPQEHKAWAWLGVLAQSPQLVPAWLVLGNAERMRDRLPQAEAAYREAVRLSPQDRDSRFNLALVLLQQLSFGEAEAWCRQLLSENPNDADAWTV